jgi:hypothetical protein
VTLTLEGENTIDKIGFHIDSHIIAHIEKLKLMERKKWD